MAENPLGASLVGTPGSGPRDVACPLCEAWPGARLQGYDRKVGPEVFAFLGLAERVSQWAVCAGCGLDYESPRADRARVLPLYGRALYREHREYSTAHFFRNRYRGPVEHVRWLGRRAGVGAGLSVLDIGAGLGGAVRAFRDLGARAGGIEADPTPGRLLARLAYGVLGARRVAGLRRGYRALNTVLFDSLPLRAAHWPVYGLPSDRCHVFPECIDYRMVAQQWAEPLDAIARRQVAHA